MKLYSLILILFTSLTLSAQKPYKFTHDNRFKSTWAKLDKLVDEGLYKQALVLAEQTQKKAIKANHVPALLNVIRQKYALFQRIEADHDKARAQAIKELSQLSGTLSSPAKELVNLQLARIINDANGYFYGDREEDDTSKDPSLWSSKKRDSIVFSLLDRSLSDYERLAATPVVNLLQQPQKEIDTLIFASLMDLVLYSCKDIWAEDAWIASGHQIFNSTDLFAINGDFEKMDIPSDQEGLFRLFYWFQKREAAHLNSQDIKGLVPAIIQRLNYASQHFEGENTNQLHISALKQLLEKHKDHFISTEVAYVLASKIKSDSPYEALKICQKAMAAFPNSKGAVRCKSLIDQLVYPEYNFSVEHIVYPNEPFLLRVKHKNLKEVYVRVVTVPTYKMLKEWNYIDDSKIRKQLRKLPSSLEQTITVNNEDSLVSKSTLAHLPPLKNGAYALMMSDQPFTEEGDRFQFGFFQASSLAIIANKNEQHKSSSIFITDRKTGLPIKGAGVQSQENKWTTDINGGIPFIHRSENLIASYKGDTLYTYEYFYHHGNSIDESTKYILNSFTDRRIYRPGQIVHLKAIYFKQISNKEPFAYTNQELEIKLKYRGKEVQKITLTTNEFGSASGEFKLPDNCATGNWEVSVGADRQWTNSRIQVEEYKRPKMEVVHDKIKKIYTFGDQLSVTGTVLSLTGAPLNGAHVEYTISAGTGYYFRNMTSNLIDKGQTRSDEKGKYSIPVSLKAYHNYDDLKYNVHIKVTSPTGETQESEYSIPVNKHPVSLSLTTQRKWNSSRGEKVNLLAKNSTNEEITVNGKLEVFSLSQKTLSTQVFDPVDFVTVPNDILSKHYPFFNNGKNTEEKTQLLKSQVFNSKEVQFSLPKDLRSGEYLLRATTIYNGDTITTEQRIVYAGRSVGNFSTHKQLAVITDKARYFPGEQMRVQLASGFPDIPVFVHITCGKEIIQSQWVAVKKTSAWLLIPLEEKHRGNLSIRVFAYHHGRFYQIIEHVKTPYPDKRLNLEWITFRDKLTPGQKESWKLKIGDANGKAVDSELLATLYDASLDKILPHSWYFNLSRRYYQDYSNWGSKDGVFTARIRNTYYFPSSNFLEFNGLSKIQFYPDADFGGKYSILTNTKAILKMLSSKVAGVHMKRKGVSPVSSAPMEEANFAYDQMDMEVAGDRGTLDGFLDTSANGGLGEYTYLWNNQESTNVPLRKNLNELAFFYPHLRTNSKGEVLLEFEMPSSLTEWHFMGLAHSKSGHFGQIDARIKTRKQLMISPNFTRFFRTNDVVTIPALINNLTDSDIDAECELHLIDIITQKEIPVQKQQQTFDINAKGSQTAYWTFTVPEGVSAIKYRITAVSDSHTDGEENIIPVLSDEILIRESLPLTTSGKKKEYSFDNLLNSGESSTLKHKKITLEYTSQPSWLVLESLPYLIDYPYDCAEQIFSKYFANATAIYLAKNNPQIIAALEKIAAGDTAQLQAKLESNPDLKKILLTETPWMFEAENQSQRARKLVDLLNLSKREIETAAMLKRLQDKQLNNGGFAWFEGMKASPRVTAHIIDGMGQMIRKGIIKESDVSATINRGIRYLIQELNPDRKYYHPDTHILLALTQFPNKIKRNSHYDWVTKALNQHIESKNNDLERIQLALIHHRIGDKNKSKQIIRSFQDIAVHSEEKGMYWNFLETRQGFWYEPVEVMSNLIGLWEESETSEKEANQMKTWLLLNKRTNNWETTKGTTMACFALLNTRQKAFEPNPVKIQIGNKSINTSEMENGFGYSSISWNANEITANMGKITVNPTSDKTSWGALHWQYFEKLDKIQQTTGPLSVSKKVVQVKTGQLADLSKVKVGDQLRVVLTINSDQSYDYVHLKDLRAAGFEPKDALSGYRYRDGLGSFLSIRDVSINFFIDHLPKGQFELAYDVYVAHAGQFSNGFASIQCMYAPEFNAHSKSERVKSGKVIIEFELRAASFEKCKSLIWDLKF